MLADARIGANVPVSNLEEAVSFYGEKLGLNLFERGEGEPYARFAGAGETKLGVYESKTAGQSKHTLASFVVDDVRSVVDELKAKGRHLRGVRHAWDEDRGRRGRDGRHTRRLAEGSRWQHPRDRRG